MIHLLNMPFGSLMRPSLALGLMKAQLRRTGIRTRAHHFNFTFARLIGFGAYETVARFKGAEAQVAEWLFADAAWGRPVGLPGDEFLRSCGEQIRKIPGVNHPEGWLRTIRSELVKPYLQACMDRLLRDGPPRVVAFSCMFFQTLAALALGRLLKARDPHITLVYGGASFHGEIGQELFEKVPWMDVVSTGEADQAVTPLFEALARGEPPVGLPGILARDCHGDVVAGPPASTTPAAALDGLPDPDYDDFFTDAAAVGLEANPVWCDRVSLPFEASRGCWWGQKKHCSFCGLNGQAIHFRSKSAETVVASLERMVARYPVRHLLATDNILAMDYFETLLPRLSKQVRPWRTREVDLFVEVKANLTAPQIAALAEANAHYVQPGIESLSSHILQLLNKGVSALQNVFFLKCATELGLLPIWNLLIAVPGEKPADYAGMTAWIPRMRHLRPPTGGTPRLECHRYSPYHDHREQWLEGLQPAAWYRGLYPEDQINLAKVAYYFQGTWKSVLGDPAYDDLIAVVGRWMSSWRDPEVPRLTIRESDSDHLVIEDTRGAAPTTWCLTGIQAGLYHRLRGITNPRRARAGLAEDMPGHLSDADVRQELHRFVEQGLALEEGDRFLGLALRSTRVPSRRERMLEMRI